MKQTEFLNELIYTLQQDTQVLAAWLGGSEATGRSDSLSDTDLVLISLGPEPFRVIESSLPDIEHRYVVKDGPYNQRFYVLKDTSATYYMDVVIFSDPNPENYREYFNFSRHGKPLVLFDKNQILEKASRAPTNEDPIINVANELAKAEIIFRTFLKERLREKFIDAFVFYHRLILIYVNLSRTIRCPQKHDFHHLRYVYTDLPEGEARYVEGLLKVPDLMVMHDNAEELKRKIHALLKGLE